MVCLGFWGVLLSDCYLLVVLLVYSLVNTLVNTFLYCLYSVVFVIGYFWFCSDSYRIFRLVGKHWWTPWWTLC